MAAGFCSISIGLDFFVSFFSLHSLVFHRNVVLWHFSSKLYSQRSIDRNFQPSSFCSHVQLKPIRILLCRCLDRQRCEADRREFLPSETWSQTVCTKNQPLHQFGLSFVFSKYVRTNQFANYNVSTYKNDLCSLCSYSATQMHIEILSYKLCSTRCYTFTVFLQSEINQSNKEDN